MPWFGLTVLEYLGTDAARETCLIFTSYFGISVIWWRTRHHGENDLRFGNFEELESKSLESKMISDINCVEIEEPTEFRVDSPAINHQGISYPITYLRLPCWGYEMKSD